MSRWILSLRHAKRLQPAHILATLVGIAFLTALGLSVRLSSLEPSQKQQPTLPRVRGSAAAISSNRLALIVPYVNTRNVDYWNVFCRGAAGAVDVADFLLIHTGVLEFAPDCGTPNVVLVDLKSNRALAQRLLRVLDQKPVNSTALPATSLTQLLTTFVETRPYGLIEFKPAYGHIFADLIQDYSHWGYTDMDVVFGDLSRWLTEDELEQYDIVTYTYGDQKRLYLRGQFTIHKNTPRNNQLWRGCDYLSNLDQRFFGILNQESKYESESAEGCYSSVVMGLQDIKVKFAPKAWSDTKDTAGGVFHDTIKSHGVYISSALESGKTIIYRSKMGGQHAKIVANLDPVSYWQNDAIYSDRTRPLESSAGALETIDLQTATHEGVQCMYWIQRQYQSNLCLLVPVANDETVYWIDGKLYKQRFDVADFGSAETAPLFHFQEWKRHYKFTHVASLQDLSTTTFLLTSHGAIPMVDPMEPGMDSDPTTTTPLGIVDAWNGDRSQLPQFHYCAFDVYPPCTQPIEWSRSNDTEILSPAPGWKNIDPNLDVTLTLTLTIGLAKGKMIGFVESLVDQYLETLERWSGQPSVTVICVEEGTAQVAKFLLERFGSKSAFAKEHPNAFVVAVVGAAGPASHNTLVNMAVDLVPTRYYLIGLEPERGLILSREASYLATQAVRNNPGTVFWIPQFALRADLFHDPNPETSDVGRILLEEKIYMQAEYVKCDFRRARRVNRIYDDLDKVWWDATKAGFTDNVAASSEVDYSPLETFEENILGFMTDMTKGNIVDEVKYQDEFPILLVDNRVPSGESLHLTARYPEIFQGLRNHNAMHLGQLLMLGYQLDVLPGVFAASTINSRINVGKQVDYTRCDSRNAFTDSGIDTRAKEELIRTARHTIMWME